jgi:hypothetical protein
MIDKDRLGYYQVGFKRFNNKTLALIESTKTGYSLEWIFNNNIYGKIDWTKPVEVPLTDLYRIRAQQIRDSYDYLCLHFSGGADSNTILHSFIDNNIFLDEIIMYLPKNDLKNLNGYSKSNRNTFGEIEFEAKRKLRECRNSIHSDTIIRDFDISKPTFELLKKDNWFEHNPFISGFGVINIARENAVIKDFEKVSSQNESKKIAHILGIDKPLVLYDKEEYYCFFSDSNAYHVPPIDGAQNNLLNNCFTEFFYWTPDLPEIVIKQAQEIKKYAQYDLNLRYMLSQIMNKHIREYREVLHPIIYPPHTEPKFQVTKGTFTSKRRGIENWFWEEANESLKSNFENTIEYLKSKFKLDNESEIRSHAINSKFYKL